LTRLYSFLSAGDWPEPRAAPPGRGGFGGHLSSNGIRPNNIAFSRGGFGGSDGGGRGGSDWSSRAPNASAGWDKPTRSERPAGEGMYGFGAWRDGKHIVGQRNQRLEKELYGEADDPLKQHTGINFEKYEDIPVEATGAGVPDPVTAFTSPPLDPVLIENIAYARYNTPTPVQKYSIPIIAGGRDLLACAQVR
jgi:ATP-dependent RNA helicase DDX3X